MTLLLPAIDLQTITFIYGLYDPITLQLRYVGKTINPESRHMAHVTSPHSSVKDWVLSLAAIGLRPEMRILERCSSDGSAEEMRWIEKSFDAGCDLLNRRCASCVAGATTPGRPPKPKREKYKTPQRQFGRIGSEDWQTIQDATAHSGIPFTRWALPVVLREARRLLSRPKKDQP